MQRIETTTCTHLNWLLSTTLLPDQIEQRALHRDEMQMIEDAIVAVRGDKSQRPTKPYTGEQQFQREADTDVRMTRNEAQHATNYLSYQTCTATMNYALIIGQYTLYDTMMMMTSDIADLEQADYGQGRATTEQFTLRCNADQTETTLQSHPCPYTQLKGEGKAIRQGHRLVIENPKMALEIATSPIDEPCASSKPLWPSTVCCHLVEFNTEKTATKPTTEPPPAHKAPAQEVGNSQRWCNSTYDETLDELHTLGEYMLARQ